MARTARQVAALSVAIAVALFTGHNPSLSKGLSQDELGLELDGKKLFDKETFGGNGRTCLTCHSKETGPLAVQTFAGLSRSAIPTTVPDP